MSTLTDLTKGLPQPDVSEAEMDVFLAITISMGHCIRDEMTILVKG